MSLSATLDTLSQQLNIYVGPVIFILGTWGAVLNILIFRHHSLRSSSYCIYMVVSSVASLMQLIFILATRVLAEGFNIDWTLSNLAWCKLRSYIALCSTLTALSCFIWAAVDRFCSTCREAKWRRLSSKRVAKRVCLCTIFFWLLVSIPALVYMDLIQVNSTTSICSSTSTLWIQGSTYFFSLLCYCIFPWFFLSLFGLLTLKNIRKIRRRRVGPLPIAILSRMARIDEQLTFMLFMQIIICIISSIPFCTQSIYASITQSISKSELRLAQENLFLQISRLTFYFNYASMFYVNFLSSRTFRKLTRRVLINLCCKQDNVFVQRPCTHYRRVSKSNHQQQPRIFVIQKFYNSSQL